MGTTELKQKLIAEINKSANADLLEELYNFLHRDNDATAYQLTERQKDAVAESRQQIENGQYKTDSQVNEEIDRWLKGK